MSDSRDDIKKEMMDDREKHDKQVANLENGGSVDDVYYSSLSITGLDIKTETYIGDKLYYKAKTKSLNINYDRDQSFENLPDEVISMSDFKAVYPLSDGYEIININKVRDGDADSEMYMQAPDGRIIDINFISKYMNKWCSFFTFQDGEKVKKENDKIENLIYCKAYKSLKNWDDIHHLMEFVKFERELTEATPEITYARDNHLKTKYDENVYLDATTNNLLSNTVIYDDKSDEIKEDIKNKNELLKATLDKYHSR